MFNLSTQDVVLSIEKEPLEKLNGIFYQEYNNFFGKELLDELKNLKNCNSNINFLVGKLDKTVPISVSKKWSQILPRTSYNEISGAGHLVHEEKPHEVSQIIFKHLENFNK